MTTCTTPDDKDPFLFDHDALQQTADRSAINQGLIFFKENCVISLDRDETTLWAQVEDEARSDFPLDSQIEIGADGKLHCHCNCDDGSDGICAHLVAALYAYADHCQTAKGILSATDTAINDRIKRGKSEVTVKADGGQPWFGSWTAASIAGKTPFPRKYRVTIRSLHKRANFCSCPDFANNQLGTCKHIEAALHKIKKHPKYKRFKDEPAPIPYVYLAWDRPKAPMLSVHRSPAMADDLTRLVDDYFTPSGDFSGRIPEDFFRLTAQVEDREDIHIGEDALNWAHQLAAEASQTLRSGKILIILDEAQRIKNWRTKVAAAVKLIPARYAFVLTGTPLENRLEDLYSLMQVVDPKILGPLWRYMVDFHVTDERGKVLGYRNLSILRKRLAPVMLRRDRGIVSDQLPERIIQRLDVPMTAKQREFHDDAMSKAGQLATIAKRRLLTPTEQNRLIAALQQACMACNAAGLVDKQTKGSPKLDEMADLLDEICVQSGLKAVVFSCWELMTRMVEKRLRKMGLGYVRLHGGVPTAKRGELIDRFRGDDAVQVFVSTDAGGVGLNLQAGAALINMDVPWNPAVLEQRNARIHRLGQIRSVQIIILVAAASYEEQVLSLVNTKQHLFDNVVNVDATEDVVGVSKKMLDTLIEELAGSTDAGPAEPLEEVTADDAPPRHAKAVHGPLPGRGRARLYQGIARGVRSSNRTDLRLPGLPDRRDRPHRW